MHYHNLYRLFTKLFWKHVKKLDACWEWTHCLSPKGYGRFSCGRNLGYQAHKIAYYLSHTIPFDILKRTGLKVLHSCDNRKCINPSHLFKGTDKDNSNDKILKGRHPSYTISDDKRLEIIKLYKERKYKQTTLGRIFGLDQSQISRIVNQVGGIRSLQLKGLLCP